MVSVWLFIEGLGMLILPISFEDLLLKKFTEGHTDFTSVCHAMQNRHARLILDSK